MILSQKRRNQENSCHLSQTTKKMKMKILFNNPEHKDDLVKMPWDDETQVVFTKASDIKKAFSRWDLIQTQLNTSNYITTVNDLTNVIKSYNVIIDQGGNKLMPNWKFLVLHNYFNCLDENMKTKFFKENGTLTTMRTLALQLQKIVPNLKLLKCGYTSCMKLHQMQIASILANAFFCTFPKAKADCPSINFNTLYESSCDSTLLNSTEKLKCIMNYFDRIHEKQSTGNLSFHRLYISDHKLPRWDKISTDLCLLKVDDKGKIEDQDGYLQIDFANSYIGGGVLGRGCVQEEIRFLVCPELIAARLFTERLSDNEALFVIGAERYSKYTGYSQTFKFAGDYQDLTPFDEERRRKNYLIALDALNFFKSSEQYRESKILRELKKAYVGFKSVEDSELLPLATGNWGCGAFGGDPQLKSILQLIASSQARRNMLYLTFGDFVLKNQIEELYKILKEKRINVGMLYRIIRLYNREKKKNQTVFEYVIESINNQEKKKFCAQLDAPSTSKNNLSLPLGVLSSVEDAKRYTYESEKRNSEKITPNKIPKLNDAVENLACVSNNFNDQKTTSQVISDSEVSSILDMMWYENEGNWNNHTNKKSKKSVCIETDPERATNSRGTPSLYSVEEGYSKTNETKPNVCPTSETDLLKFKYDKSTFFFNENEKIEKADLKISNPNSLNKKFSQPKISDFFKK